MKVVSMDDICFLWILLFKQVFAFKVIYFVYNSEENKTLVFHILHASKIIASFFFS